MSNLVGLTKVECAAGCTPAGCVIAAGRPFCMHPCKGGVPFNVKDDPVVQKLYADACAALGVKNKNVVTQ